MARAYLRAEPSAYVAGIGAIIMVAMVARVFDPGCKADYLLVLEGPQCVFIGTTNKSAYLRDETGGRRFWPVKVGRIDSDALSENRDQLFAEAVRRYRAGARWWPDEAFERQHIAPEQEARFEADAWEDTIRTFLATRAQTTVGEVASDALFIETPRIGTADQRRITAIMKRLDWRRLPKDWRGVRAWGR